MKLSFNYIYVIMHTTSLTVRDFIDVDCYVKFNYNMKLLLSLIQ